MIWNKKLNQKPKDKTKMDKWRITSITTHQKTNRIELCLYFEKQSSLDTIRKTIIIENFIGDDNKNFADSLQYLVDILRNDEELNEG